MANAKTANMMMTSSIRDNEGGDGDRKDDKQILHGSCILQTAFVALIVHAIDPRGRGKQLSREKERWLSPLGKCDVFSRLAVSGVSTA
jgi:hypothetical protein